MIELSVKTAGVQQTIAFLEAVPAGVEAAVAAVVLSSILRVEGEAKRSILRGPKSGRWYKSAVSKKMHRASAPGQAPATDSGRLANSVFHRSIGPMQAEASADVSYAGYLENGTRKMAPRPYLLPALRREEPTFIDQVLIAATGGHL